MVPTISATSRDQCVWRRSGMPTRTWPAPQAMAMSASVMNAAAVRPAAMPPAVVRGGGSDAAPTPRASVDAPIERRSAHPRR